MKIKKENFSEWYNAIIKEGELCDLRYGIKGFIIFLPWSVQTMEKMYRIYEETLQNKGHRPVWFPALIPEHFLKKEAEHIEGFAPEVFWVTEAGKNKLEEKYAMRPTSETAFYYMYSLWIKGYSDLPLKLYQRAQVWRYETKATKPFIRSREFYWIETHNAFATREEAEEQVKEDMETTKEVLLERFGIPFIFFKRPQWDKFAGAENTYAADTIMPDGRILQLPSTHMLGTHFAKAFNIQYMDKDEKMKYVWQTCYGPAISRIYAALISIHGDDNGLILPFELAPIQVVLVPIFKKENEEEILEYCKRIKEKLQKNGINVYLDDREKTPGYKFNYWEMKGVPFRIEIGQREKEKNKAVLFIRDTKEKKEIEKEKIIEEIEKEKGELLKRLKEKAIKEFEARIFKTEKMDELKEILEEKGGLVAVPFCSDQKEGKECADKIKEMCAGNVRGSRFDKEEKPKGKKCIVCGKEARVILYIGKQY